MNIEKFKVHLASRKFVPEPLRTAESRLTLPPHYTEGGGTVLLDPMRVLFVDLKKGTQTIILDTPDTKPFLQWAMQYELDGQGLRLSRFQRAYGGMMNPPVRIWTHKDGKYERSKGDLKIGAVVQCACTPRLHKDKYYFDLHRDIVLKSTPKTVTVDYFSDSDL